MTTNNQSRSEEQQLEDHKFIFDDEFRSNLTLGVRFEHPPTAQTLGLVFPGPNATAADTAVPGTTEP